MPYPYRMQQLLKEKLLEDLNPEQKRAVLKTEGPVLVLAGAGSGKTRVLTRRIAYLIGIKGIEPQRILAVTFTNKAAEEMKARVLSLLGAKMEGLWIGTFHSICVRILRRHARLLGFDMNFSIYDRDDQKRLVKDLVKGPEGERTGRIVGRISAFKNERYTPEEKWEIELFKEYQSTLRRRNAMDFDDLLLNTLELFRKHPEIEKTYSERFLYINVDEYQDTNRSQYYLLRSLSMVHRNLFVVGDEDQSIYGFRGADIRNILEFERDYEEATVIRLEENYRSSQNILKAASSVISNNSMRKGKTLWTRNHPGEKITLFRAAGPRSEADFVVSLISNSGRPCGDFLILYRTNAQSRAFEEALISRGIPYEVVGAIRFYERKEIKDLISYLRVIANPKDDGAMERIINVPPRGIGPTTLRRLKALAQSKGTSLFEALFQLDLMGLTSQRKEGLEHLRSLLLEYMERKGEPVFDVLEDIVRDLGYYSYLEKSSSTPEAAQSRRENVEELINMALQFSRESEEKTLEDFLLTISTFTEVDEWEGPGNSVTLMTVHNAKGLEFPVVVVAGLEEDLFPHRSSYHDPFQLEEERRLFHVALTRAQEKVVLTFTKTRQYRGGPREPSRFLKEIPVEVLQMDESHEEIQSRTREKGLFLPGDLVYHPYFGRGEVLEVYEDKVQVLFRIGVRTLIAHLAPLKRLK